MFIIKLVNKIEFVLIYEIEFVFLSIVFWIVESGFNMLFVKYLLVFFFSRILILVFLLIVKLRLDLLFVLLIIIFLILNDWIVVLFDNFI